MRRLLCVPLIAAGVWLEGASAQPGDTGPRVEILRAIDAGRYPLAVEQARAWVTSAAAAHGSDSLEAASSLELLVRTTCLSGTGAQPEILQAAARAVAIRQRVLGSGDAALAPAIAVLSEAMVASGDYQQGVAQYRRALAMRQRAGLPLGLELARALDGVASALRLTGGYDELTRWLEEALVSKEEALGPTHVEIATTLEHLAAVHLQNSKPKEARLLLERALTLRKDRQSDHPLLSGTYNLMGDLSWFEGDFGQAERWYARAVSLAEQTLGGAHPHLALYLRNLGTAKRWSGDTNASRALLERGLVIAQRALGPTHPQVAGQMNSLAATSWHQGDYLDARRFYEGARQIYETRYGRDHLQVATVLNNLALVAQRLGEYEGAVQLERRAIGIWERHLGPHHRYTALGLNSLASMSSDAGRYANARALFERALVIREKQLGSDHPDVAATLAGLADVLVRLNRTDEASRRLSRALGIWERAKAPGTPAFVRAAAARGRLQANQGDAAAARETFEGALISHERVFGRDHPETASVRASLATALADLGDTRHALAHGLAAEEIGRTHLQITMRALAERLALGYAAARPKGLDLAISILVNDVSASRDDTNRVLNETIKSRGVVLDEMASRHRAGTGDDSELSTLRAALNTARQRLANIVVRGPESLSAARYAALVQAARSRKEEAERAMAEKSDAFSSELARTRVGLGEVRAGLPSGAALVSFVRFDHRLPSDTKTPLRVVSSYMAFVLRPDRERAAIVPLGAAREIDALVARWRDEAAAGLLQPNRSPRLAERAYRTSGDALRRRIFDPIAAHLNDVERVFIVPDGALHVVSFAALPSGKTRFLVEDGPIVHYVSAERDLARPASSSSNQGLVAIGGLSFGTLTPTTRREPGGAAVDRASVTPTRSGSSITGRPTCNSFADLRFESLPASGREVEDVVRIWAETRTTPSTNVAVLTRSRATEAAVKGVVSGRRVLHLATHGFFLGGSCSPVGQGLRGAGGLSRRTTTAPAIDNPLLMSGLALAGANLRGRGTLEGDDGILTAEEVAALDLDGVEWAVLSACDTGLGEIKGGGEGVFGLRRAFQIAGARTVIMSLWSVEDRAARLWMRALYQGRLSRQLSTADAVREASLAVLRERRARRVSVHPFYWAGFVAAGDWR